MILGKVLGPGEPLRLESGSLEGRPGDRLVADRPVHRWIAAQRVRVVLAGQPPEYRLPQQTDQPVESRPAGAPARTSAPISVVMFNLINLNGTILYQNHTECAQIAASLGDAGL
jgi:hypothetical protein